LAAAVERLGGGAGYLVTVLLEAARRQLLPGDQERQEIVRVVQDVVRRKLKCHTRHDTTNDTTHTTQTAVSARREGDSARRWDSYPPQLNDRLRAGEGRALDLVAHGTVQAVAIRRHLTERRREKERKIDHPGK
jgi:hypothetical protein